MNYDYEYILKDEGQTSLSLEWRECLLVDATVRGGGLGGGACSESLCGNPCGTDRHSPTRGPSYPPTWW